jgi:hypothetical protein
LVNYERGCGKKVVDVYEHIVVELIGSPPWMNFDLLTALLMTPDPELGNEKSHTLIGYGLEYLSLRFNLETGKYSHFLGNIGIFGRILKGMHSYIAISQYYLQYLIDIH